MGLTIVITGNGKGKTTSALGIILRASGYSMKSYIIQFMKGDTVNEVLEIKHAYQKGMNQPGINY
jgi:ATP:corrinoid adenosyltransferase